MSDCVNEVDLQVIIDKYVYLITLVGTSFFSLSEGEQSLSSLELVFAFLLDRDSTRLLFFLSFLHTFPSIPPSIPNVTTYGIRHPFHRRASVQSRTGMGSFSRRWHGRAFVEMDPKA